MSPQRPAADMTTDELAADIRQRMAANVGGAAALSDVAARLAASVRDRLPYIDPADAGAVMVTLAAYTADAQRLFVEHGLHPADAAQCVSNVLALAGQQLYGATVKPDAGTA